jgi:hypothetical protein
VQEDKGHPRVAEGHGRKGGGIGKETTMAQTIHTQKNTRHIVEDTYIPRGDEVPLPSQAISPTYQIPPTVSRRRETDFLTAWSLA